MIDGAPNIKNVELKTQTIDGDSNIRNAELKTQTIDVAPKLKMLN